MPLKKQKVPSLGLIICIYMYMYSQPFFQPAKPILSTKNEQEICKVVWCPADCLSSNPSTVSPVETHV
ncbi:hypothetical protein ACFX13_016003 [Malus domestica]